MFGLETVYPRPKWTWRTLVAMPLVLLLIPLIILAVPLVFLLSKIMGAPVGVADLTADDLVTELRAGFASLGNDDKWEGLVETRLADAELDAIRARAAQLELPLTAAGLASLRQLVAEAEALTEARRGIDRLG